MIATTEGTVRYHTTSRSLTSYHLRVFLDSSWQARENHALRFHVVGIILYIAKKQEQFAFRSKGALIGRTDASRRHVAFYRVFLAYLNNGFEWKMAAKEQPITASFKFFLFVSPETPDVSQSVSL